MKELKAGEYVFPCYTMPWTDIDISMSITGVDFERQEFLVSIDLSDSEIQSIVDMMVWAWENQWFEFSMSETVCTELLKEHIPLLYNKIQSLVHQQFCSKYPDSKYLEGFGVYEIFCPDEILEYAAQKHKETEALQ